MTDQPPKKSKDATLYVAPSVRDRIKKRADDNKRTIKGEVAAMLESVESVEATDKTDNP